MNTAAAAPTSVMIAAVCSGEASHPNVIAAEITAWTKPRMAAFTEPPLSALRVVNATHTPAAASTAAFTPATIASDHGSQNAAANWTSVATRAAYSAGSPVSSLRFIAPPRGQARHGGGGFLNGESAPPSGSAPELRRQCVSAGLRVAVVGHVQPDGHPGQFGPDPVEQRVHVDRRVTSSQRLNEGADGGVVCFQLRQHLPVPVVAVLAVRPDLPERGAGLDFLAFGQDALTLSPHPLGHLVTEPGVDRVGDLLR